MHFPYIPSLPREQVALWINQIRMIRGLKKKKKRVEEEEQGRLGLHLASANDKLLDLGAEDFRLLGSWAPLSSIALYCCCFQSSGSLIIGNKRGDRDNTLRSERSDWRESQGLPSDVSPGRE